MLSRSVQCSRLLRVHSRALCSPSLVEDVRAKIPELKAMASASGGTGYDPTTFKADLAAGTVNANLLAETMSFSEAAKKMAAKLNNDMNLAKLEAAKDATVDWAAWEEKISSPDLVAQIKATYESELGALQSSAGIDTMVAESKAALGTIFNGADGLYAMASKEEKAADAGLLQCIADLELLEKQIENVSTQTIAEVLEQEPELREKVEEEIKNNVWAP